VRRGEIVVGAGKIRRIEKGEGGEGAVGGGERRGGGGYEDDSRRGRGE